MVLNNYKITKKCPLNVKVLQVVDIGVTEERMEDFSSFFCAQFPVDLIGIDQDFDDI